MGFPIKVSSVSHCFYVLLCESVIHVAFRGIQNTLSYESHFGYPVICRAAVAYLFPTSMSGDFFRANFVYFISLNDG